MSRKKKHEHVNHERWLVSYADFITLLFAFFVVLFASGQSNKKKQQQLAVAMQQAFSQMSVFDAHSKRPALTESAGADAQAAPAPIALPLQAVAAGMGSGATQDQQRAEFERNIAKIVDDSARAAGGGKLDGQKAVDMTLRRTQDGLVLSLHEGGFFASGSAELEPRGTAALEAIAAQLPMTSNIRVEGHTDNQPIHSALYASNWELSSARASTIARFLLEHSAVNPSHLAVAGYAEFHPIASNATAEGRAQNRRVDIVFLGGKS